MMDRERIHPDTRATISITLGGKANAMEIIAWAGLTDDELVERLANEVWRRPRYVHWRTGPLEDNGSGRVGLSKRKIQVFVDHFGRGRPPKVRRVIEARVRSHAEAIFEKRVAKWGSLVFDRVCKDGAVKKGDIAIETSRCVPRGARRQVKDYVVDALGL